MRLTLVMIRCPDAVPPERREVHGGEFTLGRGSENNWVLPDPKKHISKKHCSVVYSEGGWELHDSSSNGTFLNQATDPVGKGMAERLRDRDRIRFDEYEIEVLIENDASELGLSSSPLGPASRSQRKRGGRTAERTRRGLAADDEPFELDNGGMELSDSSPELSRSDGTAKGSVFPPDFNPDELIEEPTQPDDAPALQQAFRPPGYDKEAPARRPMPSEAHPQDSRAPEREGILPEDWDKSIVERESRAAVRPEPPRPVRPEPEAKPGPEPEPAKRPPPVPPAGRDERQGNLLAAFMRGLGLKDLTLRDPEWTLERVGSAARATVSGLRQILIARARIKDEFRINRTVQVATGNNPLKFSLDDDDALRMLLGIDHRGNMRPDEAIDEAFNDLRLHEVATISAMQTAVRALLDQLAPEDFERQAPNGALQLGAQRKAKAWDLYVQRHRSVSKALADDFDSVFGKAFARAYEAVVKEAAMKQLVSRGKSP